MASPARARALAMAGLVSSALPAFAAPEHLDPAFGSAGFVTIPVPDVTSPPGMQLQPDGKILLIEQDSTQAGAASALWRFNADGTPDSTFDTDGVVSTPCTAARPLLLQPDGKIIVVGACDGANVISLARFDAEGTLDPTFDGDGTAGVVQAAWYEDIHAVLQPDGKIVVAGESGVPQFGGVDVLLVRFNDDGSLDSSFGGGDGIAVSDWGARERVRGLALQPDGKIVLVGIDAVELLGGDESMVLVARYESDGDLDPTFGGDGVVTTDTVDPLRDEEGSAVVVQPDGKIVVANETNGAPASILLRYLDDGSLDPAFDGDGIVQFPFGREVISLALQGDGKIVAAGSSGSSPVDAEVFRRNADGSPDDTVWGDGILRFEDGGFTAEATAVVVQPDGKLLVAASRDRGFGVPPPGQPTSEIVVYRLLGSAPTLESGISAKKMVIVDVPGTSDKLVYASQDPSIDKGPGAEPPALDGSFEVYYTDDPGNGASYALPAAFWVGDTDDVARYRNPTAPGGGGVRSSKVSVIGRAKVSARSLGDGPTLDLFAGGPPSAAGGYTTVLEIVDIDDDLTHRLCTRFAIDLGSTIKFTTIADGAGRKVVALDGVPVTCP